MWQRSRNLIKNLKNGKFGNVAEIQKQIRKTVNLTTLQNIEAKLGKLSI